MNDPMRSLRMLALVLAIGLVPALTFAQDAGPPSGNGILPVYVDGNPDCGDLGYTFGYKPQPEPPPSGTYPFPGDLGNPQNAVTITSDGSFFDWSSTLGIDAVIVKGGSNASVFVYDPPAEGFSDSDLHAPINPSTGRVFGISHIEFCYDYEVGVIKDAEPSFKRTWSWTIEKTADQTEITLAPGQADAPVNYTVTVTPSFVDSDWAVDGNIWIQNPAPFPATITSVTDVYGGYPATVTCGVTFPHVLAPGASLHCTYHIDLDEALDGTNTATVTTTGDVGGGEGSAAVVFPDTPTDQVDECVDVFDQVSDDFPAGFLGTVCAEDIVVSMTFDYDINVAEVISEDICEGEVGTATTSFENTASLVTNDLEIRAEDVWVITVYVECVSGCTLTQGYWKTHSREGPAPYDDNWANLGPDEEDTLFFFSGQTYHAVLWTPPKGNVYYNLAHQYIAAELNFLNGADPSAAQAAFDAATAKFNAYTPAQVAALKGKDGNAKRQMWTELAGILDAYNNGYIGPGHCTETTADASKRAIDVGDVADLEADRLEPNAARFNISNYPDPFNPTTTLRFELPEATHVTLIVYDVLGRQIARLMDGFQEAGVQQVSWNASGLPSGTYFYVLQAGTLKHTRSMVLTK